MNKNGILSNSRFNKLSAINSLTYYKGIPRTSDLLKTAEFSMNNANRLMISNFFISPSTMRFDDMVEEIIFELNALIKRQNKLPSANDVRDESIADNLEVKAKAKQNNVFQAFLQSNGHTGVLTSVASSLNSSTMDQFSRAILSEESIFMYLAYRAIEGFKIEDAEGVGSNIMDSLDLIKSFINVNLIDRVIRKENLNVSREERRKLRDRIREKRISYFSGNPERIIVDLIDTLKSGGKLYNLVMNFINSGKVSLPRSTNKEELAQKMVDYLIKLGYNEDFEEDQDDDSGNDQGEGISVAAEFEVIEGVGKVVKKELIEVGIMSFAHLASFDVDSLKKRLKKPRVNIKYGEIIDQAKLIAQGKFDELKKLQDELNKRK